jgi:hypothetical protein
MYVVRAAPGEVMDEELNIKGLVEGRPYEFRVAAVNEAGPGEWVETDDAIKPAPPPSQYISMQLFSTCTVYDLWKNVCNLAYVVPQNYYTDHDNVLAWHDLIYA